MKYIIAYSDSYSMELNNGTSQFEFCKEEKLKNVKGSYAIYKLIKEVK